MSPEKLQQLLEAALMAYGKTMSVDKMMSLFEDDKRPSSEELQGALQALTEQCESRGIELKQVAGGYRFQARQEFAEWVARLWEEKPPKYSRALLETIALIAYRQPITRTEIEEVRGVSVSTHIVKTLLEREWVRVVGHRDVPGRPSLYATTKDFLDYFNLKSLEELPSLAELRDLDKINAELELEEAGEATEEELRATLGKNSGSQNEDSELEDSTIQSGAESDSTENNAEVDDTPFEEQDPLDHSKLDQLNKRLKSELSDEEIAEEVSLAKQNTQVADPDVFNDSVEPDSYSGEPVEDMEAAAPEVVSVAGTDSESELDSSLVPNLNAADGAQESPESVLANEVPEKSDTDSA